MTQLGKIKYEDCVHTVNTMYEDCEIGAKGQTDDCGFPVSMATNELISWTYQYFGVNNPSNQADITR